MVVSQTDRSSLESLLRPAEPVPMVDAPNGDHGVIVQSGGSETDWLTSGAWRLLAAAGISEGAGTPIATFTTGSGSAVTASFDETTRRVMVPFSLEEAYRNYITERWASNSQHRRLSPHHLNLFYRTKVLVPRNLQIRARRMIIRWQGRPEFPEWPLDLSVARLLRFYAFCILLARGQTQAPFRWFWPNGHGAALILTHDVENDSGIRNVLALADLEEGFGLRSSFNFGAWYTIDPGLVRELLDRGFEVGVHGLRHDRSLFHSREAFEAQLPVLATFKQHLGGSGFRSPATYRVHNWLADLPFDYDCSVPHSDPYEPQPGGCCTLWPFFIGPLVELPYTLPQDYTLFTLLGHRTPDLWIEQADRIEKQNGLIQCVSHPDRGYLADREKNAHYSEFLAAMSERSSIWKTLPQDVASWWRLRGSDHEGGSHNSPPPTDGLMHLGATPEDVCFEPTPATTGSSIPGSDRT